MTRVLASSWAHIFESDLLSSLETKVIRSLEALLSEFENSCPMGLRERARQQGHMCVEQSKVALQNTIDIVNAQLSAGQKDVSRCLAPTVRDQMYEGYRRAMEERGRGSVARQKVCSVAHNKSQPVLTLSPYPRLSCITTFPPTGKICLIMEPMRSSTALTRLHRQSGMH